ncbi:hypothetical protein TNCV_2921961 [Trichonephila clavipes]|nr:hypothetical protein TNCV_2921961 [Trichonephila clavipes]
MADCEVEGTIASPLSIPPERAMSPTEERRDERRNIRTRESVGTAREADAHRQSSIEAKVGITFQDGDRFNSCQVIYSQFVVWQFIKTIIKQGIDSSNGPKTRLPLFPIFISEFCLAMKRTSG